MKPATPGTVLTAIATVLLALASFNVPLLKQIYYFKASFSSSAYTGTLTLGTLGYCLVKDGVTTCSSPSVGYELDLNTILGVTIVDIPEVISKWITYVLVAHIIALGLSLGACILGLLAHIREFAMGCCSAVFASLAAGVALIAFIFDIVLFVLARTRINSIDGASSSLGPGIWIVLAAWVVLFLSGCAYGCGRRCITSRGPRNERGERGDRVPFDTAYAEEARVEAIRAEEERKARQAGGGSHLPGFQPYETQPLTGAQQLGQVDQWLEEEDPALAGGQSYRDQPAQSVYGGRQGSSDGGHGYGRAVYGAGMGSAVGVGRRPSDPYRPEAQRTPSDQYYAGGQSTPGGYPPVSNDHSNYYDPQDSYQQTTYPPQHQQPQDPYYQAQPRSPHPDQYGNPHPSTSPYSATSGPNVIAGVWNPPRQQQPYQTSTSPQQQQGYASPPNNNAYSPDPRSAMQHNFASPPPPNPQAPINQDAYASDAYGGYAPQQPASPVNNVYAPSPQRLVPQHPASFTPGGHDSREESGASSGSVYYDASAGQASGSGGGGGAGVVEPPSYELSSIAPGQTDVASGSSSGFPREKGGYQPGAGR